MTKAGLWSSVFTVTVTVQNPGFEKAKQYKRPFVLYPKLHRANFEPMGIGPIFSNYFATREHMCPIKACDSLLYVIQITSSAI